MAEPRPDEFLHKITSDLLITTDVDDLVDLVKAKKEIPMSEAAKQLKVSLQTVEAWAGFLEEEGILAIKYKLTTPYLVEKTAEAEKQPEDILQKKTKKIKLEESQETKPKLKSIEISLELTKSLNNLLEKAYNFIEKGDFASARHVYNLIEQNYQGLPTNFMDIKKELGTNLTKLNKDLAINLQETSAKQAKLLSKLISSELRRMSIAMMKKDIKKAESIFTEVEQLYSRFPDGFVLKKTSLQNQILDAYKNLARHKHTLLTRYIKTKTLEIEALVKEIKTNLTQGSVEKAFEDYEKLRAIYNKIPKGFLQDNPKLEREVIQLSLELVAKKQELSARKVTENTQKIKSMIASTKALLNKNQVDEANNQYQQLKKLYDELPAGFLKTKVELEEQILKLHQVLTKGLNHEHIRRLNQGTKKINSLIKKAQTHLKNSEPEIAEAIQHQIEHHYKLLPEGFLQQKTALRVRILSLYRNVLLKSDESILKEFDAATDKKHKQLIRLIMKAHHHIEESQFELLEVEYKNISKIFGHLPFSLVEQKTKLRQEVSKLQSLVDMYRKAKQFEEKKNNPAELNLLLKQTGKLYNTLIKRCPGDENLFIFVKQRLDKYKILPIPPRSQPLKPRTITPRVVKNLLAQAESHLNKNNLVEAQNQFKRVLRLDSRNPIAKSRLSLIEHKMRPAKAEDIYQKSISRVKSREQDMALFEPKQAPQAQPKEIEKRQEIAEIKKPTIQPKPQPTKIQPKDLKAFYKKLKLQRKPEPTRAIQARSIEELYKDAERYYDQKDYYNAIKLFRVVKKRDPKFKDVQKLLHQAIREQDKLERQQMLSKIKAKHEEQIEAITKSVVKEMVETPKLETKKETPIERKTERINTLTNLKLKKARELVEQNRVQEATSILQSILKINPDSVEAKHMLEDLEQKQKSKSTDMKVPIPA